MQTRLSVGSSSTGWVTLASSTVHVSSPSFGSRIVTAFSVELPAFVAVIVYVTTWSAVRPVTGQTVTSTPSTCVADLSITSSGRLTSGKIVSSSVASGVSLLLAVAVLSIGSPSLMSPSVTMYVPVQTIDSPNPSVAG